MIVVNILTVTISIAIAIIIMIVNNNINSTITIIMVEDPKSNYLFTVTKRLFVWVSWCMRVPKKC